MRSHLPMQWQQQELYTHNEKNGLNPIKIMAVTDSYCLVWNQCIVGLGMLERTSVNT